MVIVNGYPMWAVLGCFTPRLAFDDSMFLGQVVTMLELGGEETIFLGFISPVLSCLDL